MAAVRVHLVRWVEKWEDRKDFNFPLFCVGWEWKSWGIKKVSLYKFTYIPLLKNDAQLKQKKNDKQAQKNK